MQNPYSDVGNTGTTPLEENTGSEWAFLDLVDPLSLSIPRDLKLIKSVSKQFARATVLKLGSMSRMEKLLQVLQIVIRVMSKEGQKRKETIHALQQKLKTKSKSKTTAEKCPTVKTVKVIACRCPVCQVGFKSLPFLDAHVFSKHPEVAALWQAIRTPQPPGAYAFPWTKSYSMHSSMLPPNTGTVHSFNEATVQQMFDEFKRRYETERKNSEQQTHTMIKREMEKFTAKMEDLQTKARFGSSEPQTSSFSRVQHPPKTNTDMQATYSVGVRHKPATVQQVPIDIPPQRMEPPVSPIEKPPSRLAQKSTSSSSAKPSRPATPQKVLTSSEMFRPKSGSSIDSFSYSSGKVLKAKEQAPAPAIDVPNVTTPSRQAALESFLSDQIEEEDQNNHELIGQNEEFHESSFVEEEEVHSHDKITDDDKTPEEEEIPQHENLFDDFGSYSDLYHAEPPPGGSRLRNSDSLTGMQIQSSVTGSQSGGSRKSLVAASNTASSLDGVDGEVPGQGRKLLSIPEITSSTPSSGSAAQGVRILRDQAWSGSAPLTDDQRGNTPDLTVRRRPTLPSSDGLFGTENEGEFENDRKQSFDTDSGRQTPVQAQQRQSVGQPLSPAKMDFDGFDVDDIDLSGL